MVEEPADSGGAAETSPEVAAEYIAADANAYHSVNGWLRATGFRTHGLLFKDLGGHPRGIGEEFLVQTRYRRADREMEASVQAYFVDAGTTLLSRNGHEDVTGLVTAPLPETPSLRGDLGELLAQRRSVRSYTGDEVELATVAAVLRAAGAITGVGRVQLDAGGERAVPFRTAPSAGGLYPLELWLLPLRVTGLRRAVWRYDPRREVLVEEADEAAVAHALGAFTVPEELLSLNRAAFVLVLVGRPWKLMRKYGQRGVRFLFIEAGAMAENVHLACRSLKLGSVDCASVCDDELHAAMGLDGELRLLAHSIVVGAATVLPSRGGRE